jgi:hypothetical protein
LLHSRFSVHIVQLGPQCAPSVFVLKQAPPQADWLAPQQMPIEQWPAQTFPQPPQ